MKDLTRKTLKRTEHPNIYLYQGSKKTSYITFYKGRHVTLKSMEDALSAFGKMQTSGKDADIQQITKLCGVHAVNITSIMKALRCRSKAGNIPLRITASDIEKMRDASRGFCSITGIQFNDSKPTGKRFRPWMPSVDRIDSSLPYTSDNCRLVCAYANIAINDLGEEEFFKLAKMFIKTKTASKRKEKLGKLDSEMESFQIKTYPQPVTN
ncbi:MAG: hypothetical protein K2Y28_08530 [Burkholderiaceae bacterium]|nr:hypothetical protein [Burkholderiaceae bacterium]